MSRVSQFVFDLGKCPPQVVAKGGTIQEANQSNFTSLAGNGLAIYLLTPAERFEGLDLDVTYIAPQ
ncbi:MAG TPA: hypothetical protein VGP73_26940 [Thermoanaerobaculia bacterium]